MRAQKSKGRKVTIIALSMVVLSVMFFVLGIIGIQAKIPAETTCEDCFPGTCDQGACAVNDEWKTIEECTIWCRPPDPYSYTFCYE